MDGVGLALLLVGPWPAFCRRLILPCAPDIAGTQKARSGRAVLQSKRVPDRAVASTVRSVSLQRSGVEVAIQRRHEGWLACVLLTRP